MGIPAGLQYCRRMSFFEEVLDCTFLNNAISRSLMPAGCEVFKIQRKLNDLVCQIQFSDMDNLAERSKAVDSSSTIFGCVGSNPTAVISFHAFCLLNNILHLSIFIRTRDSPTQLLQLSHRRCCFAPVCIEGGAECIWENKPLNFNSALRNFLSDQ